MLISKTYCNITIFVQCTWKHIPNIDYHLKKLKDVKAIIESLCWNVEYPLKLSTTQTRTNPNKQKAPSMCNE